MIKMSRRRIKGKLEKIWDLLKVERRSTFNIKYRSVDTSLSLCIKWMERGVGGDIEVIFVADASEEEINKVLDIIESEM